MAHPIRALARAVVVASLIGGVAPGCEPTEAPPGATPTAWPSDLDYDGDGYTGDQGDCDDLDRDVGPDMPERCNGVDDDCDHRVDESGALDARTWHADRDDDGWGDPAFTQEGCDPPPHYVANSEDCDDGRSDVYPDAPERCDLADNDCDGEVDEGEPVDVKEFRPDKDGDGYGVDQDNVVACSAPPGYVPDSGVQDCDDTNAASFPGNPEVCDGVDNDCDGQVDEPGAREAPTWYSDVDGDGYGATATGQSLCQGPTGWVTQGGDCNESDAAIHPGADERCADGVDNDCDGLIDDPTAVDARPWFRDTDEDGFGDPTHAFTACAPPTGYVSPNTDCDDTLPWVNPDADEVCTALGQPQSDEDCDGRIDEADAVDASLWYVDGDGDGFGQAPAVPACVTPSGYAAEDGDCDDSEADVNPAAEEVCDDGVDNDCDGGPGACSLRAFSPMSLADADLKLVGDQAGALAGEDVALVGDVNGDGYADLAVGAWSWDAPGIGADAGAVFLFYGPLEGRGDGAGHLSLAAADLRLVGEGAGDHAGTAVRPAGDVNGDGYADLIVGASQATESHTWQGAAYVLFGPLPRGSRSLGEADVKLLGEATGDFAGSFVSPAGDVNGDGRADLLIGAPGHDEAGKVDVGATYLLLGPLARGTHGLATSPTRFLGEVAGDQAGSALDGGVDLDGDASPDLVIGAPGNDEAGANEGKVYVVHGPLGPQGARSLATADVQLLGEQLGTGRAGSAVASVGDLDADGVGDLLVGAPLTDPVPGEVDNGTAYAIYGPLTGNRAISSPPDVTFDGAGAYDQAGIALAAAGDMNHDGYADALVGAWRETDLAYRSGAVRLYYGPLTQGGPAGAPAVFTGEEASDVAGIAVAGGQDLNGDGLPDVLIGAPGNDEGGQDAGAAYVIFGVGM